MDTPAKSALGGGLITALAMGGLVTVGVTGSVLVDPGAPPAQAAGLTTFDTCAELREWYVDHAIGQVGPYGWDTGPWSAMRGSAPMEDSVAGADSGQAVTNGETGTNTQEAGVDEPDVAKTDGRIVVRLQDNRRLVVTDVSSSEPRELAAWHLPAGSYADGLLLVDDHVLLAGGGTDVEPLSGQELSQPWGEPGTDLYDVDVSDPTAPRLESHTRWSGRQLSLRQYGDTVRLVTARGLPQLPFVAPAPGLTEDQAERRNREVVRDSTVEDWAPGLECGAVYHPQTWSGPETVTVTTFRAGAAEAGSEVSVTGAGAEVYSSTDRLYVTATDWGGPIAMDRPMTDTQAAPDSIRPSAQTRTHLHAFALEGATTRYLASGDLDGRVRDRWSLDEHDGHLRVAVSWPGRFGGTRESGIVVLDERAGRLVPVGELRGLGIEEEVQSVRWFDDLAVVVTFRQVDPLYTVDLSDPQRPRQLGELKIPGFSSYLHPVGGERLLGVGTDASPDGGSLGAQAAVFDIGDRTRARQVGKVTFGEDSRLGASDDPHAFTWLPGDAAGTGAAITSLQRSSPGSATSDRGATLVLLRVSPAGQLSTEELPSPGGWQPRALPLEDGRVALVGEQVRVIDLRG
jgi:uncharacterized secreted protein with C-terminal beta-propeller domain